MPWDVQALGVAAVAAVAVPVAASLLKKAWYGWGLDLLLPFYRIDSEIRAFGRDKSTIQTLFRRQAQLRRNKPMVVCQGTVLTWHEMDTLSDTVSTFITTRCGKATAGGTSNTVAVMMVNSPEFVAVYLGAAKAGYTMSLLNPALRGKSLEHCIGQSKAKMMFVSSEVQHGCDVVCIPNAA
jgi:acyl-CoA synthetase (AMP-forming)/AMP-acid ligase II